MKNLNQLLSESRQDRFLEILLFATTGIKNKTCLDIFKKALIGVQDKETLSINETRIISELSCKGFLSRSQAECLTELAKVS